jgi:hypothetical protein
VAAVFIWNSFVTLKKTVLFSVSGNSVPCYVNGPKIYLVEEECDLVEEIHALSLADLFFIEDRRFLD